jgi:hypothetical protein
MVARSDLGLVHGLFSGTALVDICSADPSAHGTPSTSAPSVALIEPPGFMMLNYASQPRRPRGPPTLIGGLISLAS